MSTSSVLHRAWSAGCPIMKVVDSLQLACAQDAKMECMFWVLLPCRLNEASLWPFDLISSYVEDVLNCC